MSIPYHLLQPVQLRLSPDRRLELPSDAHWSSGSVSPNGEVYLTYFVKDKGSKILDETGKEVPLRPPGRSAFWLPYVQRFTDDRWLVAESLAQDGEKNAFVFEPDGTLSHSFHAGDDISQVLVDRRHRIWIGYGNVGTNALRGGKGSRWGPNGLVRTSNLGLLEFGFNESAEDLYIVHSYALTIDEKDRAWSCPYSRYFVASVEDEKVQVQLKRCPVNESEALLVGEEFIAFLGAWSRSLAVLVERQTRRVRSIDLGDIGVGLMVNHVLASHGERAVAVTDNGALYRFDLDQLLDVLGPWTDRNSSTVESAIEGFDDEW